MKAIILMIVMVAVCSVLSAFSGNVEILSRDAQRHIAGGDVLEDHVCVDTGWTCDQETFGLQCFGKSDGSPCGNCTEDITEHNCVQQTNSECETRDVRDCGNVMMSGQCIGGLYCVGGTPTGTPCLTQLNDCGTP